MQNDRRCEDFFDWCVISRIFINVLRVWRTTMQDVTRAFIDMWLYQSLKKVLPEMGGCIMDFLDTRHVFKVSETRRNYSLITAQE